MNKQTIDLLNEVNRKFYNQFAPTFAASRARSEPGLERLFKEMSVDARVLDLGCGQGRIALLIPPTCTYTGMDFSSSMLEVARTEALKHNISAEFCAGDLLSESWPLKDEARFDWIILRAILHHIPGAQNRINILRHAQHHLAPQGKIVLANWQFLDSPRLQRRLLDWDVIDLSVADVQTGDYLLDWKRDGYGIRYVHLLNEVETQILAAQVNLNVVDLFRADGHQNNLTLYAILSK